MSQSEGLRLIAHTETVSAHDEVQMPHRTYKYVIVEADTRTLELFVAAFTAAWGMLFSLSNLGVTVKAWASIITVEVFGSPLWALFFIAGGFFQAIAIHYKYPTWRRGSAATVVVLWVGCAFTLVQEAGVSVIGFVAVAFAVASAWIMWHRQVSA